MYVVYNRSHVIIASVDIAEDVILETDTQSLLTDAVLGDELCWTILLVDDCNLEATEELTVSVNPSDVTISIYPNDTAVVFIYDNEGSHNAYIKIFSAKF